jgi:GxxExxY protein
MDVPEHLNELTHLIIGKLIRVHRVVGPGLLESVYRRCVAYELRQAGCRVEEERAIPLVYEEMTFDCAFRLDMIVNDQVVVEIKAVEALEPVHGSQLLTYLRLAQCPIGLLANFNTTVLKNGLKRFLNPAALERISAEPGRCEVPPNSHNRVSGSPLKERSLRPPRLSASV